MSRDRGFVTLGLLLIVALAAGDLAAHVAMQRAAMEAQATSRALAEGRDTLLGFTLTYPNRSTVSNRAAGPGLLPCPDTRFDANDVAGQADPPCALSSGTETGLLPWRTLASMELRDGAAAPLWYALANGYRNSPAGMVNSDSVAGLRLDDCSSTARGYVALLLAPGAALAGQSRNTAEKSARYLTSNYLELANASRGDACFGSAVGDQANDVVLGLSRETVNELLAQRVLGEVARALRRYRADPAGKGAEACGADQTGCGHAWPWLAPWQDPASASFLGEVGTRRALLPLRRVGVAFAAPFTTSWSLASGVFLFNGAAPPAEDCMRRTAPCTVPVGAGEPDVLLPALVGGVDGRCVWNGGTRMRCTTTQAARTSRGALFERRWQMDFEELPRTLRAPDPNHPRRERAAVAGTLSSKASIRIAAADFLNSTAQGDATLTLGAGAVQTQFEIDDIPFDIEVDDDGVIDPPTRRSPGELPAWLVANRWHQSLMVVLATGATPGSPDRACVDETDCLLLQSDRGQSVPASAALVLAGAVLPGQLRSRGLLSEWFEDVNALGQEQLREAAPSATFNDRVLRLDADD